MSVGVEAVMAGTNAVDNQLERCSRSLVSFRYCKEQAVPVPSAVARRSIVDDVRTKSHLLPSKPLPVQWLDCQVPTAFRGWNNRRAGNGALPIRARVPGQPRLELGLTEVRRDR